MKSGHGNCPSTRYSWSRASFAAEATCSCSNSSCISQLSKLPFRPSSRAIDLSIIVVFWLVVAAGFLMVVIASSSLVFGLRSRAARTRIAIWTAKCWCCSSCQTSGFGFSISFHLPLALVHFVMWFFGSRVNILIFDLALISPSSLLAALAVLLIHSNSFFSVAFSSDLRSVLRSHWEIKEKFWNKAHENISDINSQVWGKEPDQFHFHISRNIRECGKSDKLVKWKSKTQSNNEDQEANAQSWIKSEPNALNTITKAQNEMKSVKNVWQLSTW